MTSHASRDRAQTLNDQILALSLFLTTALFVFAFINGVVAPNYGAGSGTAELRADRIAQQLVSDTLINNGDLRAPGAVNEICVEAFFSNTASGCGYEPTPLGQALSAGQGDSLYVAIMDSSDTPITVDGVTLERGTPAFQSSSSVATERAVVLNGELYTLRVVVI